MSKKLFYLVSMVLVLGLALTNVASAGLLGWWPLNEGSGDTVIDLSASGNDGTINNFDGGGLGAGGAVWVNDPERGMVVSFSGDNSSGAYISTDLIIPPMDLDNDFTWALWIKQEGDGTGVNEVILGNRYGGTPTPGSGQFIKFTSTRFEYYHGGHNGTIDYDDPNPGEWVHFVVVKEGDTLNHYRNAELSATSTTTATIDENPFGMGGDATNAAEMWSGHLSDVRVYDHALSPGEILGVMQGAGGLWPFASGPTPGDGDLHADTWVNVSWRAGGYAVSHDVYLGESFEDVDSGAEGTFLGNQTSNFFVAGFPGFAYPDGLVPGTTYYWRIDEVNDAEPNSPWKGDVWSFSIPPKTAYFPDPADGAESVGVDVTLSWTQGFGAKLHTPYFGETFDEVDTASGGMVQGTTTYKPGTLKMAKTYYWRVDEFDIVNTFKGDVWSFTTEGAVGSPSPANGAVDITQTPTLTWTPGFGASYDVYFGADAASMELKGSGNLGSESFEPGQLEWDTTYYWRIDEANNANADSPWTGPLWSFTTANFLIIDDMESYNDLDEGDPDSNRIYLAWIDGFDNPATNGSVVGNLNAPFAEQTIVNNGSQSMPMAYDNAVGKSEATLTLAANRDWTVNGVDTLTIWFRGNSSNAAETLYVALNGNAKVNNDDPDAATINNWTEWNIPLQAFADQGINLANVNSITLGLSSVTGGTGMMYFDDIRLYPPAQ
ncbi:MAG: LamG-like jellyroll fold domain-containing protein [Sedimentisphaerales bacterium]|nr:LamG-like jellyroll fold domain-containing protein [Sedimentisphaerales bacterium]